MSRLIAPLGALVLLCACQDAEQAADEARHDVSPPEGVLARYEGGEVTVDEVDARILAMPASERLAPGADRDEWYADIIRKMAADRLLLEQARTEGLEKNEEFRMGRLTMERQLALRFCLAETRPDAAEVTERDLEAAYAEREARLQAPERRLTHHIYLRKRPDESIESVESRARALRERILRGESFKRIAQAESDSESRHRQGSLDWIVRGQLPEAFEAVVFSLEEGVPSEPVIMADGVHLFQVDEVLAERQLSRQEAFPVLRPQLASEKVADALDELAGLNTAPTVSIVDRSTLERMVEESAEDQVVLTARDHTLSLRDFRLRLGRFVAEQQGPGRSAQGRVSNDLAWQLLQRMQRHEQAYEHCVREDLVDEEQLARRMAAWEEPALTARMRQQRLRQRVMNDPERLELFYQSNIGQFTPPVEWNLERLRIPFDNPDEGMALMARLEAAAQGNSENLETLRQALGGEIVQLGWISLEQMSRLNPKLPPRVAPLAENALVAPLRVHDLVEIYRVVGRRQFDAQSFDQVRDEVASAYLGQYASEIYDEVESALLARAGFELYHERLDALPEAGVSGREISVEELDALLSGS